MTYLPYLFYLPYLAKLPVQDLSPSPPSHELQRWLVAHNTMVGEAETAYRASLVASCSCTRDKFCFNKNKPAA